MQSCDTCGKEVNMPYTCNRCSSTFCSDHRLPENHDCPNLYRGGFDPIEIEQEYKSQNDNDRITNLLGNIPSMENISVNRYILGIIVVTYILQFIVLGIFGSEMHNAIFTLSSENPAYIWTWFTSIVSHSPQSITHILFNSIVILFFGSLIEDAIGSRKYAVFFVVCGLIAGLAQLGLALIMNETINILGASGTALGLLGILTILKPDLKVYLYFIVPVPIWVITIFYVLFSVYSMTTGFFAGTAHMAHLAGLVIGLAYGQKIKQRIKLPRKMQIQ